MTHELQNHKLINNESYSTKILSGHPEIWTTNLCIPIYIFLKIESSLSIILHSHTSLFNHKRLSIFNHNGFLNILAIILIEL